MGLLVLRQANTFCITARISTTFCLTTSSFAIYRFLYNEICKKIGFLSSTVRISECPSAPSSPQQPQKWLQASYRWRTSERRREQRASSSFPSVTTNCTPSVLTQRRSSRSYRMTFIHVWSETDRLRPHGHCHISANPANNSALWPPPEFSTCSWDENRKI